MSLPASVFIPVPGGEVHARHWPAPAGGDAPPLVLVHATGMCGAVYADLLGPLARHPGRRFSIHLLDMRGHGRTRLAATPGDIPVDWAPYRADLLAVLDAIAGARPVRLAGHSFGATVACELAARAPGRVGSLLLLDPAFVPFADAAAYGADRAAGAHPPNPMAEGAERRRPGFASRAEARERLRNRGVFAGWPEAALEAYLADGLTDTGALACSPAWEATSFRGVSTTLEASLAACGTPMLLLCGEEGSTVSPADAARIAALRPDGRIVRFPGTGHFFPVTHPELVRPHLLELAELPPAPPRRG